MINLMINLGTKKRTGRASLNKYFMALFINFLSSDMVLFKT